MQFTQQGLCVKDTVMLACRDSFARRQAGTGEVDRRFEGRLVARPAPFLLGCSNCLRDALYFSFAATGNELVAGSLPWKVRDFLGKVLELMSLGAGNTHELTHVWLLEWRRIMIGHKLGL